MLKVRVVTAVVLLAILLTVLFSGSFFLFVALTAVFFAATAWESLRLFQNRQPLFGSIVWTAAFVFLASQGNSSGSALLFALCAAIWLVRLLPSLAIGLPSLAGLGNHLLNGIYGIAILGCFLAVVVLFRESPLYLLSVLAIVWIADIGAYFSGKAFGKRKLAPSISPGKSWEGAIGGWLATLLLTAASCLSPWFAGTFAPELVASWGWGGFFVTISLLVAASVVGDLFESQLKRRAGAKDSSNLLPGHGGVLDRVDALIPVLPLAALASTWF